MNSVINSPTKVYASVGWFVVTLLVVTGRFGPVNWKIVFSLAFFAALCWVAGWLEDEQTPKSWGGYHLLVPAMAVAAGVIWFYPFKYTVLWWGGTIIATILSVLVVMFRLGENVPDDPLFPYD